MKTENLGFSTLGDVNCCILTDFPDILRHFVYSTNTVLVFFLFGNLDLVSECSKNNDFNNIFIVTVVLPAGSCQNQDCEKGFKSHY